MRIGDWITSRVNELESWDFNSMSSRWLLLLPIKTALILFLLVTNIIALLRWPFISIHRLVMMVNPCNEGISHVGSADLEKILTQHSVVLVDFYAEWCGPCMLMNSTLHDLAQEWNNRVRIVKVDATLHPMLTAKHNVKGLPTFLLFIDKLEKDRYIGSLSSHQLRTFVGTHISLDSGLNKSEKNTESRGAAS